MSLQPGKAAAGRPLDTRLSLQRGVFLVSSDAERRQIAERAYEYYKSFDNVFGGPGIVDQGIIRPLREPRRWKNSWATCCSAADRR